MERNYLNKKWVRIGLFMLMFALCLTLAAAAGAENNNVTVKVNGQTGIYTPLTYTRLDVEVIAPGATAVLLKEETTGNSTWWNKEQIQRNMNNGGKLISGERVENTEKRFYAKVFYGEYEDYWGNDIDWENVESSAVVIVQPQQNGVVWADPEVVLSATTLAREDWLTIQVTPQEQGEETHLYLEKKMDNSWYTTNNYSFDTKRGTTIQTATLEPGEYRAAVVATVPGCDGPKTAYGYFTVSDGDVTDGLSLSTNKPFKEETFHVFGHAEGADRIQISVSHATYNEPDEWEQYGENIQWESSLWNVGDYTFTLYGIFGDEEPRIIDEVTVTVTLIGTLPTPTIQGVPGMIKPNTAVNGSITVGPEAERCSISLEYCGWDRELWENLSYINCDADQDGSSVFSFPADLLTREGWYYIYVNTNATGYESGYTSFYFLVSNSEPSENFVLTVNGSADEQEGILNRQDVRFRVVANESKITNLQLSIGYGWYSPWGAGNLKGTFDHTEPYWSAGRYVCMARFSKDNGKTWTYSNPVTVNVISPYGQLKVPEASLSSSSVKRGETITLSVDNLQNVGESYEISIYKKVQETGGYNWVGGFGGDRLEDMASIPIMTYAMDPGEYRADVQATAPGWVYSEKELFFTVEPNPNWSGKEVFQVNKTSVETLEPIILTAYVPNATRVKIEYLRSDSSGYSGWTYADSFTGMATMTMNEAGIYEFTLVGLNKEGNEFYRSSPKKVTVIADGNLGWPRIYGVSGVVPLGNGLDGYFDAVPEAQYYEISVSQKRGENGYYYSVFNDRRNADEEDITELNIPASVFATEGIYNLSVTAKARGKNSSGNGMTIRVVSIADKLPHLEVEKNTCYVQQSVGIIAYALGAESMKIYVRKDGELYNWYTQDGGGIDWYWNPGQAGTYKITAEATYLDEATGERFTKETDPYKVTVKSNGTLTGLKVSGVPDPVKAGTTVNATVTKVTGAEQYYIDLYYCGDNGEDWDYRGDWTWKAFSADTKKLTISGDLLNEPGFYYLNVYASASKKTGVSQSIRFLVTDGQADERLTLTVNGSSANVTNWPSNKKFSVQVNAPDNVTAVRIRRGSSWEYFMDTDDYFIRDWSFSSGKYVLTAQATTDNFHEDPDSYWSWEDLNWSLISNTVTMSVKAEGTVGVPTLTVPRTVERGDWLEVEIGASAHADNYYVGIARTESNEEWESVFGGNYPSPGTIRILTDSFKAGKYQIWVSAQGEGYDGRYSGDITFTVTENNWQDNPIFRVEKQEVQTFEEFGVSVYAPGADCVKVCHENMENQWATQEGDGLSRTVHCENEEIYVLVAYAHYPDNSEWQQVGEKIPVTATAPNGSIGVTVNAPLYRNSGESFTFTVTYATQGLSADYRTQVLDGETWQPQRVTRTKVTEDSTKVQETYKVDANSLAPGLYIIETDVFPKVKGYARSQVRQDLVILGNEAVSGTVSVSKNPVEIGEDFQVTADVSGATALAIYTGEGDWRYKDGDHADVWARRWNEGNMALYARYTTQAIDWEHVDMESFDWESVTWEGVTSPISLTVNPGKGKMPDLDYDMGATTVTRGESFEITIHNKPHAVGEWYGAQLCIVNEKGEAGDAPFEYYTADENGVIHVETMEPEAGNYILQIMGNAPGYYSSFAYETVTIEPAEPGLHVSFIPEEAQTTDRIHIEAFASGANRIYMMATHATEQKPEEYHADKDYLRDNIYLNAREDTVTLTFTAKYANGETFTETRTIEVLAPNGDLHAPVVTLGDVWQEGEDLVFTVNAESADQYNVSVRDMDVENENIWFTSGESQTIKEMRVKANQFKPGKVYSITVFAMARGYNASSAECRVSPLPTMTKVLKLPGLTVIPSEAFSGIAAEKIIVPDSVDTIEAGAFADCPNLWLIEMQPGIDVDENAFGGNTEHEIFVYGKPGLGYEKYEEAGLIFVPVN